VSNEGDYRPAAPAASSGKTFSERPAAGGNAPHVGEPTPAPALDGKQPHAAGRPSSSSENDEKEQDKEQGEKSPAAAPPKSPEKGAQAGAATTTAASEVSLYGKLVDVHHVRVRKE
jgi:hypothetical protein